MVAKINEKFGQISKLTCDLIGTPMAMFLAVMLVIIWGGLGPIFHWSESHQLFINTVTTIITFWMVFLIQNTQNRDSKALHLKLDEVIRAHKDARNSLVSLEYMSDKELQELQEEFDLICERRKKKGGNVQC